MHIYEQIELLISTQLLINPMLLTERNEIFRQLPSATEKELKMNPRSQQFKNAAPAPSSQIKPLPRTVSKNYQELAHFINLQLKQRKLDAQTCYPWELNCNLPPHP